MTQTQTKAKDQATVPETAPARAEKRLIVVANGKGGVGKTTTALLLADLLDMAEADVILMEIDTRKRLSGYLGEAVNSLEIPSHRDIRGNRDALIQTYDPVLDALEESDTVLLDIGANEDQLFFEWARLGYLADQLAELGATAEFVVVTVDEPLSIEGAEYVLREAGESVPGCGRTLVLNERDGARFRALDTAVLQKQGVRVVRMPAGPSEIWEDLQTAKLRFAPVLAMEPRELREKFGHSRARATRARGELAVWFGAMREALDPIVRR